ncbi:hypothetical protein HZH68_002603 [Vespula germanica]|uniref:Uncharacterized protein n=1 Tax=Vespula germanica TaxID=30212 RepID=A0A834NMK9_VESGE|nr:hypothetical protein HZH68_002603 [Vespula germanica]
MHSYADASGDFLKTESDMEDALTKEKTNESSWRSALLLDSSTTLWLRYVHTVNRFREPEEGPRQLANFQAAGKGEDNWRKRFFTMDSPCNLRAASAFRGPPFPTNVFGSFRSHSPQKKWVGPSVRNYVKPTIEIEPFLNNTAIRVICGERWE